MEKTWTIVKFVDDSSVAAVPTSWIHDDFCLWPPFPAERLNNAIRQQKFDTCWPSHRVEIFRNATYDSYEIARQKARKAEYTSDLNTDTEGKGKRKIFKTKTVFSSSSESETDNMRGTLSRQGRPKPPTPIKLSKEPRTLPIKNKESNDIEIEQIEQHSNGDSFLQSGNKMASGSTRSQSEPVFIESQDSFVSLKNQQLESIPQSSSSSTSTFTSKTQCQCYCPKHAEFNSEILRQLYFLRSIVTDLMREINNLKIPKDEPVNAESESFLKQFMLPLEKEEDLLNMEEFLNLPENFNKLVMEISKWGGNNLQDFIKRVMGILISNQLAVGYSWLGRREKKEFSKFKMSIVIIDAALKTQKCKEMKEAEAEIGRWLRRAADRMKSFKKKN